MSRSHLPRQSSVDLDSPDRPFDNIINFRDVGRSINRLSGKRVLKEGVFFRSARLDDASERDKRRLTDELHISTIIDLRSSTEHQMATDKRRLENNTLDSTADTPTYTHLPDLPGVQRYLISLTGRAFERSLLWKLDWWNFVKVLALVASGYRTDAVILVGQQVMKPRGLIGLAKDTLDSSTAEMREVFELLAGHHNTSSTRDNHNDNNNAEGPEEGYGQREQDEPNEEEEQEEKEREQHDTSQTNKSIYPILVHCTQGKDRTGLIVLLALMLTGVVDEEALIGDYVQSEGELTVEFEDRMKEIRMLGLDEEYTKCPVGFTSEIRQYLEEKYGGVNAYLRFVGIDQEMAERIRTRLRA